MIGLIKAAATGSNPGLALLKLLWKPLLGLVAIAALALWIRHTGYVAAVEDGRAELEKVTAERDAAATRANTAESANGGLAASELAMRGALGRCTAENERLADEGLAAVQAAEAEKARAEQDLAAWRRKFGPDARTPNCKLALANLAKACPIREY